jgi:hypothetical protein
VDDSSTSSECEHGVALDEYEVAIPISFRSARREAEERPSASQTGGDNALGLYICVYGMCTHALVN